MRPDGGPYVSTQEVERDNAEQQKAIDELMASIEQRLATIYGRAAELADRPINLHVIRAGLAGINARLRTVV